jgi:hypothetical protein
LFTAGYRLTGPTIFCRTSGLVGIVGFVAEMGLFTAEYRLNGPRILSRISEIVRFGGLSRIAPPEALGSFGFPTISSMSFSHCCE